MSPLLDAEVIVVGDEILKGERHDAHIAWLGRALARYGARVNAAAVVGDDEDAIASAVRDRLGRVRVLIVTGGLGPTPDDVTRDGVARGLGRDLEFDEASWAAITAFFAERGRIATENNRRQAHFPAGADVLGNARGTAPGFAAEAQGTTTFVVPGPPHEMQRMFEHEVAPRMSAIFNRPPLRVETFRTFGVGESQLMEWFEDLLGGVEAYRVSSLPWITGVDIILTARPGASEAALDTEAEEVAAGLADRLGTKLYEHGIRALAEVVGAELARRRETVAVAESLTGGMIATLLTDHAGASTYLLADVVAYSNASKHDLLGVDPALVEAYGAVSEPVCRAMAEGARARTGATWALSTTGIAGPTGATPDKPLGLTWIGLAGVGQTKVKRRVFAGERHDVRRKSAYGALWMLYDRLMRPAEEE